MNANDLLDAFEEINDKHIQTAQRYREGKGNTGGHSRLRILLIAAVVSVLLTGCAVVYALRLADTKLGVKTITVPGQSWHGIEITPDTEETRVLRSLQGTVDGPNNQAMQEWLSFRESYDQDHSLMKANEGNKLDIPEKYYDNDCYTWDMVAKMDEILNKYHLDLLTGQTLLQEGEFEKLLDYLNIPGILREGSNAQMEYPGGYYYKEGTFSVSAFLTLTDGTWEDTVFTSYRYSLKAYLDLAVGLDAEGYKEWDYTTSEGVTVLLALRDEGALLLYDQGEAFITVSISPWFEEESFESMNPSELEQFAEVFDFTLVPQPDMNAFVETEPSIPAPTEWTETIRSLADIVSEYLEFTYYPDQMMFAFKDVDGDDTDELVLRIVDKDESVSLQIYEENDTMQNRFNMVPINFICENNILESHFVSDTVDSYEYFTPTETGMRFHDNVVYSYITRQWMRDRDGPWGEDAVIISEEEAQRIIDSYKHIELDWKPITDFPMP